MTRQQLLGGTMLDASPRVPFQGFPSTEGYGESAIEQIRAAMNEVRIRESARLVDAAFGYDSGWSKSLIRRAIAAPYEPKFESPYQFVWPQRERPSYVDLALRYQHRSGLASHGKVTVICPA